ncbi:MAG TPA: hypothetical protein VHN14_15940 [Kofleriaceae bacterium]|jgi:hypothetical protein|nr:hypothetical protein [Kofleriaceae bacterium]
MSARVRAENEVPLDAGARDGTEHWRDHAGVSFCHWDRWLLRLALDEPNGLRSVVNTFQQRARRPGRADTDAEAMLAQLADLEARIAQIGCGPQDLLDDVERSSKWLHDKAFRRIWHGRPIYRTEVMRRTPRNLLEARAREGNWAAFSVSPGPYFTRLQRIYEHVYVDWRGVGSVVLLLRIEGDRMLAAAAASRDDVLAVRRAIVGAPIDAMAHADDAGDELGRHFRDEEELYLGHLSNYLDRPGILRDLLELATWEDYGLFHHIEAFLKRLPERAADLAVRELARVITELRAAGLDYQVSKAQRLRRLVLASADDDVRREGAAATIADARARR